MPRQLAVGKGQVPELQHESISTVAICGSTRPAARPHVEGWLRESRRLCVFTAACETSCWGPHLVGGVEVYRAQTPVLAIFIALAFLWGKDTGGLLQRFA